MRRKVGWVIYNVVVIPKYANIFLKDKPLMERIFYLWKEDALEVRKEMACITAMLT